MKYIIVHKSTGTPIEGGGGRNFYFSDPEGIVYHGYKRAGGDIILTRQDDLMAIHEQPIQYEDRIETKCYCKRQESSTVVLNCDGNCHL